MTVTREQSWVEASIVVGVVVFVNGLWGALSSSLPILPFEREPTRPVGSSSEFGSILYE